MISAFGQYFMRLGLFILVNIVVAAAFGAYATSAGYGAGAIVLIVIGVLAAVQLTYVLWLVAISYLKPARQEPDATKNAGAYVTSGGQRLSNASSRTSDPAA